MIDKSNIPILISMPRNGSHYVGNYIREVYKQNGMIFPGTSELFSKDYNSFSYNAGLNNIVRYFEDTRNTFGVDIHSVFHAPHLMQSLNIPSSPKYHTLFDWFKDFYDGYKIFLLRRKNIWKTYMSWLFHSTVREAYNRLRKNNSVLEHPWHNIEGTQAEEILKSTIQMVNPKFVHNEQMFYKFCANTNYFEEEIITYYVKGKYNKNLIMNFWLEDLNDELLTKWFVTKDKQTSYVMDEKLKPFSIKYETYYKKFDLEVVRDKFMKVYNDNFKHYGYEVD